MGSKDTLDRDVTADLMAAEDVLKRGITGIDVVKALAETGFVDVAECVEYVKAACGRRLHMQTAAILDKDFMYCPASIHRMTIWDLELDTGYRRALGRSRRSRTSSTHRIYRRQDHAD